MTSKANRAVGATVTPAEREAYDENRAQGYARSAHKDQRYGLHPYNTHLEDVRRVLRDFGHGGALGIAAWLHDVVEDTDVTIDSIEASFGTPVAELVWAVTGVGSHRKERNQDAYRKILRRPRATILKLADRIANVEACAKSNLRIELNLLDRYRDEYFDFRFWLYDPASTTSTLPMWERLEKALYEGVTRAGWLQLGLAP